MDKFFVAEKYVYHPIGDLAELAPVFDEVRYINCFASALEAYDYAYDRAKHGSLVEGLDITYIRPECEDFENASQFVLHAAYEKADAYILTLTIVVCLEPHNNGLVC